MIKTYSLRKETLLRFFDFTDNSLFMISIPFTLFIVLINLQSTFKFSKFIIFRM